MNIRTICLGVLCCLLSYQAFGNDTPTIPKDCHLTSGAVLHHVSVIRWGKETVTLKHDGGADPIRYENMSADDCAAFEAARDYAADNPAPTVVKVDAVLTGQAFVNTVGGPVKVGGMTLFAFPIDSASAFDDALKDPYTPATIKLPKPLAGATTDGDGNFKMTIPGDQPFVLFGQVSQAIGSPFLHRYYWRVVRDKVRGGDIVLSQQQKNGGLEAQLSLDIAGE